MKIDLPSLSAGLLGGVGIAGLATALPVEANLATASSTALFVTAALVHFGFRPRKVTPKRDLLPQLDVSTHPYDWLYRIGVMRDGLSEEDVSERITKALLEQVSSTAEEAPHTSILHHVLIMRRKGDPTAKGHPSRVLMDEVERIVRTRTGIERSEALRAVADRLGELPSGLGMVTGKNGTASSRLLNHLYRHQMQFGVFPTAEFTWLKHVDRTLWYALNNLGRRTFHVEGLGPITHYRAEKLADSPIPEPDVTEAAEAMMREYHDFKSMLSTRRTTAEGLPA